MLSKLKQLKQDTFLKNYIIYFAGSMVVAVLNYAFHPILGRLLEPAQFGDIQALLSLLAQSAVIFGAFSVMVVNITTNTDNVHERNAIITELQKIAFWIVSVALIAMIAGLSALQSFFNFSSIYPLVGVTVMLLISAYTVFRTAFLQGSGRFTELSVSGVISSFGRLFFAVVLIVLGFGTLGATAGIVLSNLIVAGYLYIQTRSSLNLHTPANLHVLEKGSIKKELVYGVLVFFATGLVTLFYTIDVLIIKRYFSVDDAGLYSGISAIAKILFFVIGPSSAVLLSSIKIKHSFIENFHVLKKSLGIALLVGGVGILAFYLFYDVIITLMIGERYGSFAYLLPSVGWVMLLSATMNIFVYYFLALRRFFLIGVSVFGVACLGFILFQAHSSIEQVITNLLVVLSIINLSFIFIYAKDYFNHRSRIQ